MIRASLYFVIPFDFSFWPLISVSEIPSFFPLFLITCVRCSLSLSLAEWLVLVYSIWVFERSFKVGFSLSWCRIQYTLLVLLLWNPIFCWIWFCCHFICFLALSRMFPWLDNILRTSTVQITQIQPQIPQSLESFLHFWVKCISNVGKYIP